MSETYTSPIPRIMDLIPKFLVVELRSPISFSSTNWELDSLFGPRKDMPLSEALFLRHAHITAEQRCGSHAAVNSIKYLKYFEKSW